MGIVVEGARSSAEGLVDQEDPEDLEEGTQTRTVIRATAQPQFTEAGMSSAVVSRGANSEKRMRSRCLLCPRSPGSVPGSSPCTKT